MAQLTSYTYGSLSANTLNAFACRTSQNQLHQSSLRGELINLAQSQLYHTFMVRYIHNLIVLIKIEELNLTLKNVISAIYHSCPTLCELVFGNIMWMLDNTSNTTLTLTGAVSRDMSVTSCARASFTLKCCKINLRLNESYKDEWDWLNLLLTQNQ